MKPSQPIRHPSYFPTPRDPRQSGKSAGFWGGFAAWGAALMLLAPCIAWAQEPTSPIPQPAPKPATWEKRKAAYDYTKPADFAVTVKTLDDEMYRREHLSFQNAKGQTVTGLFVRPKAEGVYPVALVLHGLRSDKEEMFRYVGRDLVKRGIACLLLDADLHGERREPGQPPGAGMVFFRMVRTTVPDYRLALDYLATRKEVDPKRISLLGYSMGAMMGSILAGVDERVSAAALCVGGDIIGDATADAPPTVREMAETIAPANYVGRIAPRPVLFINAKDDRMIPKAAAQRLQAAAKEPKTILTVEGGHIIPLAGLQPVFDWLAAKVKATPIAPTTP
jgi:uncharacterized protein